MTAHTRAAATICLLALLSITFAPHVRAGEEPDAASIPSDQELLDRLYALRDHMDKRGAEPVERVHSVARPTFTCPDNPPWKGSRIGLELRIRWAVLRAASRFDIPLRLLHSVIRHESNYDPYAVSRAGAQGLMQLMPSTAHALGVECPFDPGENILAGARYLRELRDHFGTWREALAAYNAGPRRVERGHLPRETRRYVSRVLAAWKGVNHP